MADGSTARFFQLMNEANAKIAADEEARKAPAEVGDPVRIQRMTERRERLGQLRAREHPSKRPQRPRNPFGHVRLD